MKTIAIILLSGLWWGSRYTETLQQIHQEWLFLPLFLGLVWAVSHRMILIALLLLAAAGSLGTQLFLKTPLLVPVLQNSVEQQSPLWIQGIINNRSVEKNQVTLHLLSVKIHNFTESYTLNEAQIHFYYKKKTRKLFRGRSIQISGNAKQVFLKEQRLHLVLTQVSVSELVPYETSALLSAYSQLRKEVFLKLIERARFYLSPQTLKIYLPVALAKRVYSPKITQLFRQSGMAHLLAISGLHIVLIYTLLMLVFRIFGILFPQLLHWIHFPKICMSLSIVLLWIYVSLIGFPLPALRAVLMLSLLILFRILGQVALPLYALFCSAFIFLATASQQIYELSFQLSFTAVFFILLFLPQFQVQGSLPPLFQKFTHFVLGNLWITVVVLLGIAPILLAQFHKLSFEVLWLNLILIPLLAFWVLPLSLLALSMSLWNLNQPPFAGGEYWLYQGVEQSIGQWLSLLEYLHNNASWAMWEYPLNWEGWNYVLYYCFVAIFWVGIKKKQRGVKGNNEVRNT